MYIAVSVTDSRKAAEIGAAMAAIALEDKPEMTFVISLTVSLPKKKLKIKTEQEEEGEGVKRKGKEEEEEEWAGQTRLYLPCLCKTDQYFKQ